MKRRIVLLVVICLVSICLSSAGNDDDGNIRPYANLLLSSPNAASLGVYGNIPVGHYTGIPEISIPIYEIDLDGKKIPISLSYHASGIRVNQESSWVGLGWSLNAGGVISVNTQGYPDLGDGVHGGYYSNDKLYKLLGYEGNIGGIEPKELREYAKHQGLSDDMEPDLYTFSFGGYSGNMFLGNIGINPEKDYLIKPILRQPKEHLDVTYDMRRGSWKIYDKDGYAYYFSTNDKTKNKSSTISEYRGAYQNTIAWRKYINTEVPDRSLMIEPLISLDQVVSWYIDSIQSPQNNVVRFKYRTKKDRLESTMSFSERMKYRTAMTQVNPGPPPPNYPRAERIECVLYSESEMEQSILEQIVFPGGVANFGTSQNRKDLKSLLYEVKASKLDYISIKNNVGDEIKNVKFSYSYKGDTRSHYSCRLMLDSLIEDYKKIYVYKYNTGNLPPKHSLKTDHWGMYNDGSFQPTTQKYSFSTPFVLAPIGYNGITSQLVDGRDKSINERTVRAGILNSIKYPTSGMVSFEYEPNRYMNAQKSDAKYQSLTKAAWAVEDIWDVPVRFDPSRNDDEYEYSDDFEIRTDTSIVEDVSTNPIFLEVRCNLYRSPPLFADLGNATIGFRLERKNENGTYEKINVCLHHASSDKVGCKYGVGTSIGSFDGGVRSYRVEARDGKKIFPKGTYRMAIVKDQYLDEYSVIFDLLAKQKYEIPIEGVEGGGLRIKRVTTEDGNKERVKNYVYQLANGESSGKLMTPPAYNFSSLSIESTPFGTNYPQAWFACEYFEWASHPFYVFSYAAQGAPVGYSRVEEFQHEGDAVIGHTDYVFNNEVDSYFGEAKKRAYVLQMPTIANPRNGLLDSLAVFGANNQLKSLKTYDYLKSNDRYISGLKVNPDVHSPDIYKLFPASTMFSELYTEYSHTCEAWLLNSEKEYQYTDEGTIVTEKHYDYDPHYSILNNTIQTDSKGKIIEQKYVYPFDAEESPIHDKMLKSNLLLPIESFVLVDGKVSKASKIQYYEEKNTILPHKYYTYNTSVLSHVSENLKYEEEFKYGDHNSYGKVGSIIGRDNISTVYLWGYNGQYPIAEIKNATYQQVVNALGGTTPEQLAKPIIPNMEKVEGLRRNILLKDAAISTYTYKPLVGVTMMKDIRENITYYNYDSSGRLKDIRDKDRKIIEAYDYNYAGNKP